AARGVAGQPRVLRKLHARCRAVAKPLLGNEGRPKLAPLRDRKMPRGMAVYDDCAGVLCQPFSRQSGKKLVLTVAGDTGDAQDFATLELEGDVSKPHAVRIVRLEAEVVDNKPRHGGFPVG